MRPSAVDLDADPFVPCGLIVDEHQKGGYFKWSPSRVALYPSVDQKRDLMGYDVFRKELEGRPVYNANLLDYLIANPHQIPEEWKGYRVFFLGTKYRDSQGNLRVRCLYWGGTLYWFWGGTSFDSYHWGRWYRAAVPLS